MSNPRVTITLGRAGQVVKRGGMENSASMSSSKRHMRDRLGLHPESSSAINKRRRGHGHARSSGARIGQNDLRLKLLRKKQSMQKQQDLEERRKLDSREYLPGPVRSSHSMLRHQNELRESSLLRRRSPIRSADDLFVESSRQSYSSRELDGLRSRSPDRTLRTTRGLSPPRIMNRQMPSIRSIDASRSGQVPSNSVVHHPSRTTGSSSIPMRAPIETSKPVPQLQPANGVMQRSSHMGEEPMTIPSLLHSLGLGKYLIHFQAEEVDMAALRQMGDGDLKEMGIPMGPRKKILLALKPRPRRQPP